MTTTTADRQVNDIVAVDSPKWPGTWRVVKVNTVTYKLLGVTGRHAGTNLKCSKSYVIDAPAEGDDRRVHASGYEPGSANAPAGGATVESVPVTDPVWEHETPALRFPITIGTVVTSTHTGGDLMVVFADKGERVNCVKVGGNNNRYQRLPRRMLTLVEAARITVAPADGDPGVCGCTTSTGGLRFAHLRTDHNNVNR